MALIKLYILACDHCGTKPDIGHRDSSSRARRDAIRRAGFVRTRSGELGTIPDIGLGDVPVPSKDLCASCATRAGVKR